MAIDESDDQSINEINEETQSLASAVEDLRV